MRPFTATSPCCRSARLLPVNCVAIAPGADVAAGVFGLAAHGADRSSRADERAGSLDEGGGLRARDEAACGGALGVVAGFFRPRLLLFPILLLALDRLVGDDDEPVVGLVVAEPQRSDGPRGLDRLEQGQLRAHSQ